MPVSPLPSPFAGFLNSQRFSYVLAIPRTGVTEAAVALQDAGSILEAYAEYEKAAATA